MRNSVSSDIDAPVEGVVGDPDGDRGGADLHPGSVVDGRALDPVAVDEHPVGGPEVTDLDVQVTVVLGHEELDVTPAHAGVVDPHVRLRAAAPEETGRQQRVSGAVDLDQGPRSALAGEVAVAGDR